MAAFEAANGIIIFEMTTVAVVAVVQQVYFADMLRGKSATSSYAKGGLRK